MAVKLHGKTSCTWCQVEFNPGEEHSLMQSCDETHCPFFDSGSLMNKALKHAMGMVDHTFNNIEIVTQPPQPQYGKKPRVRLVYDWPPVEGHIDRRDFI